MWPYQESHLQYGTNLWCKTGKIRGAHVKNRLNTLCKQGELLNMRSDRSMLVMASSHGYWQLSFSGHALPIYSHFVLPAIRQPFASFVRQSFVHLQPPHPMRSICGINAFQSNGPPIAAEAETLASSNNRRNLQSENGWQIGEPNSLRPVRQAPQSVGL